ncbi:hypothetical protein ACTXT7_004604 [Hymenolepis weldensis]
MLVCKVRGYVFDVRRCIPSEENYIRSVNQLKYVTDIELTEMGMSRPEIRRLRKHFEKECPQTTMGKLKKKLARSTSARPPPSRYQRASTEPPGDDRESIFGDTLSNGGGDSKHIAGYRVIPVCELELTSPLGQGEFGRVHQICKIVGIAAGVTLINFMLRRNKSD